MGSCFLLDIVMRWIRFIGDIHADFETYKKLLWDYETIQVGDYGIGFGTPPEGNPIDPQKDQFIRGNHDDPLKCTLQKNWIADGTFDGQIFFIGGAESIDRAYRIEGKSWWPEEELSHSDFYKIADSYSRIKPDIVVTHDAPDPICHYVLGRQIWDLSRTQQALGALWAIHKPKLWIFGHYHKDFDGNYDGTRFVCLNINETMDIDVDAITENRNKPTEL